MSIKQKKSNVVLVCNEHNIEREFNLAHAQRLLEMENNGGWTLPEDSIYTYTKEKGIINKSDKRDTSKAL